MQTKKKQCKGNYRSGHYTGCGEMRYIEKYGLCLSCFREWCYSTGEGREYIQKNLIPQAKKEVKKKEKKRLDLMKKKLETKSDLEKKLQKEINLIVRLIDKGHKCISSGRNLGKNYDAGHLFSVGSNPTIRFHLFNIFAQSVHDNQWKSGNQLDYVDRLKEVFGKETQEYCLSLKNTPAIQLSKEDIKDKTIIAKRCVKWLKLQDRIFATKERLELRKKLNKELGIYK